MNKSRLEAFTDAIVAIAATIMVLELHTPSRPTLAGFLEEIPTFLTYIVSFVLIYLVWYNHHNLFNKATVISTRTYFLNGLWIFWLTLIPFTTRWVGAAPDKTVPELFYTLDLFLWSLSFQLMDHSILRDNPDAAADETDSPCSARHVRDLCGVRGDGVHRPGGATVPVRRAGRVLGVLRALVGTKGSTVRLTGQSQTSL